MPAFIKFILSFDTNWLLFSLVFFVSLMLTPALFWIIQKPIAFLDKKRRASSSKLELKMPLYHLTLSSIYLVTASRLNLPELFQLLIVWLVISLAWSFNRVVGAILDEMKSRYEPNKNSTYSHFFLFIKKIIAFINIIIGLLFLLHYFGVNITSALAGLGIGGLAIAMAAKDTLSNIFGFIIILFDRPFAVGDWIQFDQTEGVVVAVGFRSTEIKTFYDSVIYVPNSVIANATVDNIGKRRCRRARFTLGLTYSTPADKLKKFTSGVRDILLKNPKVRDDVHVAFSGFSASSLDIFINFFLQVKDWEGELKEKEVIYTSILDLAHQVGVEFAFPSQSLYFENALPTNKSSNKES